MSGYERIKAERERQPTLGFTAEHDKEHARGSLERAGYCYLSASDEQTYVPGGWPWTTPEWKPKDRKSNLIRGAALMLAEAERPATPGWKVAAILTVVLGIARLIDDLEEEL